MTDHHRALEFKKKLGQTNLNPYLIDVERAEGIYIWDKSGKRYMDMIAGVAVNNIGHCNPLVQDAMRHQIDKYLHVMVYGEFIQDTQLTAASKLLEFLPPQLNQVYFVNSGTEANEAALKLAKRTTGRNELIACKGSYHGNTHGSMSVSWNETKKAPFRPLLPQVKFIELNNFDSLELITDKTAGVIIETIQGDAGIRKPSISFIKSLREKCNATGAKLIFDEVQVGLGRTGKMFAFEHYNVVPDILTLGKALGGGMPVGAFVANYDDMILLADNPMLGHITTFGGHPVICAAVDACLTILKNEPWINEVESKGHHLETLLLQSTKVKEIRRAGLMLAIELESADEVQRVVQSCLNKGLIGFWFLSCPDSFRLSPPISITMDEIKEAASIILEALNE